MRPYISLEHPAGSVQHDKQKRFLIERANHRAWVAGTTPTPDNNWYDPRRHHNAKKDCTNKMLTAVNALEQALIHHQVDHTNLETRKEPDKIVEVRQKLIRSVNTMNPKRPALSTGLEINTKPDGEKYYSAMNVATLALKAAHEYSKEYHKDVTALLVEQHAVTLNLLSPPAHMSDIYLLDTTIDTTFLDVVWTPKPDEWKRGRR